MESKALENTISEPYVSEKRAMSHKEIRKWNRNVKKLYVFQFVFGFFLISGVMIPFFTQWGQLTFVEIMLVQSYFTICVLILEIPCGAISDYFERRISLFLGSVSIVAASIVYTIAPSIVFFILGETCFAFGHALISGTDQAVLFDTLKKIGKESEISKKMAISRGFLLAGITISAPIGSILAFFTSLPMAMRAMCIPFTVAAIIALLINEPNHDLKQKSENYLKLVISGLKTMKRSKTLRILAFDMILAEVMVFFLIWIYQLYLDALFINEVFFGFVAAGITLSEILFTNLAPKLESKTKHKKALLRVYTLIPGLGAILMAWIYFTPISMLLLFISIGFGMARSVLFVKTINNQIESKNRATVLSTVNMIGSLVRTILYPLIGLIVMLNLNVTFLLLGIVLIIVSIFTRVKSKYF